MTTAGIAVFILLAVAGLAAWRMVLRSRARASERRWLPRELQHAQLAFAEKTFRTWRPIGLIARIDRGYRLNGEVYLAEFKTRTRAVVYPSDVIELSAQRLVVQQSTGQRVSEVGYVLTQDPSGRHRSVHRVHLLPKANVIAVARRREGILNDRVVSTYTDSEGLCRDCSYRAECKSYRQDRG